MNKQPLISVIIPVYKVEEYLDECISSVVSQTYENLEIILVDDGSPDNCPVMCDEWAKKDSRIKVIHKKNGGLSDSRNAGLGIAAGEYISFVDSDDLIAPDMIDTLYGAASNEAAEIAECNYIQFKKKNDIKWRQLGPTPKTGCFAAEAALLHLLDEDIFKVVVWNKLYKRKIIEKLRFEKGRLHEDVFFTYQAFGLCRRIAKVDVAQYGYRKRSGSIMDGGFSLSNLDAVEAYKCRYYYMADRFPNLSSKAQAKVVGICIYLGQMALRSGNKTLTDEAIEKIKSVYDELYDAQPIKDTAKQLFWYRLARKNLERCCKVRNKLGIGL